MKRKLLFSTAMLVVAASAMAQNDITPSRYDFANQPEGQYVIDGCNNGWGPGNLDAAKESKVGYVNATGGAFWDSKNTDAFKNLQAGLQILDLTAEGIGKVLCFKGVNCDDAVFSKGTKATGSIPAWTQLAFYSDPEKTPTGGEDAAAPFIRVSITYKAWEADPDPDPNSGIISKLEIKAVGPNSVLNSFSGILSFDMMVKDVETEEMYELNEGWQKVEYDFQVGTPDGNPFAFTIGFNGAKFDTGALLIKEIKFTSPTDGAYAKGNAANFMKYLTLENGQIVTGINTPTFEGNKVRCNVSNNLLTISNLEFGDKVEVYSILGTLISSQKATSDVLALPLNGKGVFIVKTKTTTTKVVNN